MKRQVEFVAPESVSFGGRWRKVRVWSTGSVYFVGIVRGRPVRIPYKPRGENRGFKWRAQINDERGRQIDSFECSKSCGYEGALRFAGLLVVPEFRQRSLDWFRSKR